MLHFCQKNSSFWVKTILWFILCFSALLRIVIVIQGGQFFFMDERRYVAARQAINDIFSGNYNHFLQKLFGGVLLGGIWCPPGVLFTGLLPAFTEHFVGEFPVIPALFFSIFSVVNIFLVFKIAKQNGGDDTESLLAAFFFSLSCSMFYYARHILPYDVGLTLALLTLLFATKESSGYRGIFWGGFLASITFLIYNGYWTFAAFAMVLLLCRNITSFRKTILCICFGGCGFAVPIIFLILGSKFYGTNVIANYIRYARSAQPGIMGYEWSAEWRLPIEFLWHTEHFIFLIWLCAVFYSILLIIRQQLGKRAYLWCLGLVFIYGALVFNSVVMHRLMICGRHVRPLVPFFCLLSAYCVNDISKSFGRGKYIIGGICFLVFFQASYNFYIPLKQSFYEKFSQEALRKVSVFHPAGYSLLFASPKYICPVVVKLPSLPPHKVIMSCRNPFQFIPYQYEGLLRENQKGLRENDVTMKLIFYDKSNYSLNIDTDLPDRYIEISTFTATPSEKIILKWTTECEIDIKGFNLYRAASENGGYEKINSALIPAKGFATQGIISYEFVDKDVRNKKTYYYKLEDINLKDYNTMHGPVSVTPKLLRKRGLGL